MHSFVLAKKQFLSFQRIAHSLEKTPGCGVPPHRSLEPPSRRGLTTKSSSRDCTDLGTLCVRTVSNEVVSDQGGACLLARRDGHARSNRSREVIRLCSCSSRSHISPRAWPGAWILGPQWLGKKHHGKSAHRPPATHARPGSLRRPGHSKPSGLLSKAPRLRSRRGQSLSVSDRRGISGDDWDPSRHVSNANENQDRLTPRAFLSVSSSACFSGLVLQRDAPAYSSHRRAHGQSRCPHPG